MISKCNIISSGLYSLTFGECLYSPPWGLQFVQPDGIRQACFPMCISFNLSSHKGHVSFLNLGKQQRDSFPPCSDCFFCVLLTFNLCCLSSLWRSQFFVSSLHESSSVGMLFFKGRKENTFRAAHCCSSLIHSWKLQWQKQLQLCLRNTILGITWKIIRYGWADGCVVCCRARYYTKALQEGKSGLFTIVTSDPPTHCADSLAHRQSEWSLNS